MGQTIMHPYAPPRRKSAAGIVVGMFLGFGFLLMLVVVGAIGFVLLARNESHHMRAVVEQERAQRMAIKARVQAEAVRHRALEESGRKIIRPGRLSIPHRGGTKAEADQSYLDKSTPYAALPEKEPIQVANREITLALDQNGDVTMDGKTLTKPLKPLLRDAVKGRESAVSVVIKADKNCKFQHVAQVLSFCQDLDIRSVRIAVADAETD